MKKPNTPVSRVPREALAPRHQQSWDRSMSLHGDATFVEVMANAPEVYDWYTQDFYQKLFYSGRVDKRIVELVRFKFANLHGCASCNRGDRLAMIEVGFTEEQVDAISDYEGGPFSEREKAALLLADVLALTNPVGELTPEIYSRVRQSFNDAEIVELGMIMAVLAGVSKMIFAYDLLERTPTCPFTAKKAVKAA